MNNEILQHGVQCVQLITLSCERKKKRYKYVCEKSFVNELFLLFVIRLWKRRTYGTFLTRYNPARDSELAAQTPCSTTADSTTWFACCWRPNQNTCNTLTRCKTNKLRHWLQTAVPLRYFDMFTRKTEGYMVTDRRCDFPEKRTFIKLFHLLQSNGFYYYVMYKVCMLTASAVFT